MSLNDLPRELLIQILADPVLDKGSLCAAVRLNKLLSLLIPVFLYNDVFLSISPSQLRTARSSLSLLNRTVASNSVYASLVRSIHIRFDQGTNEQYACLNRLLGSLTNIKSLTLHFQDHGFEPLFLHKSHALAYMSLQYVNIQDIHMTSSHVLTYMSIPNITELIIGCFSSTDFLPANCQPNTSTLKTLRITSLLPPGQNTSTLLCLPQALEVFTFECTEDPAVTPVGWTVSVPRALRPLERSLVELRLKGSLEHSNYMEDSLQFDLSLFGRLKVLVVPDRLLFFSGVGNLMQPVIRGGIYKRLPYRLEHLEIFFDWYANPILPSAGSILAEYGRVEDFTWLTELAQHMTCLKKLEATARASRNGLEASLWVAPEIVQTAFDGRGIEFQVWMRQEDFEPYLD